jgi:hypothetical protein
MIIPNAINDAFYAGKRSEQILYIINDTVLVIEGSHEGSECAVISVEKIDPEVFYLVENLDGTGDMVIQQTALKLLIPSEVGNK